jgi:hypothetical protein
MKHLILFLAILATTPCLRAEAVVTNVRARQLPGEHRAELTYDLANAGGGVCAVQVRVSTDSGANYGEPLAATPQKARITRCIRSLGMTW